jgi:hypothetical protein
MRPYETHLHRALARAIQRKSGRSESTDHDRRTFPRPYPEELMEP